MPTSIKKNEANRLNAQKSTGPRTEEGKSISRRNSWKHGLTGAGEVLDAESLAELEGELAIFTKGLKPKNDYESRMVEHAALASARLNRCARYHEVHLGKRRRHATRDWDDRREAEVAHWAGKIDEGPAVAVKQLERTAEGCDWLADQWDALGQALAEPGVWDHAQKDRALSLLGHDAPPTAAAPTVASPYWLDVLAVSDRRESAAEYFDLPADEALALLPEIDGAKERLAAIVAGEIERLTELGDAMWRRYDGPDREAAPDLALFDPSDEANRLRQYEAAAERSLRRALKELETFRRQDRLGRDEPTGPGRPYVRPPYVEPTPMSHITPVESAQLAPKNEPKVKMGNLPGGTPSMGMSAPSTRSDTPMLGVPPG